MAYPDGSPLEGAFEKLVNKKLEEWHNPGLSIAVVHNDQVFAKVLLAE